MVMVMLEQKKTISLLRTIIKTKKKERSIDRTAWTSYSYDCDNIYIGLFNLEKGKKFFY